MLYKVDTLYLWGREGRGIRKTVGRDLKGKLSPVIYLLAIVLAMLEVPMAGFLYVLVALVWLIPDRRIERVLSK